MHIVVLMIGLLLALPAAAFSPDSNDGPVGERGDEPLSGYEPIPPGSSFAEAKRILGKDGIERACDYRGRVARCLEYLQMTPQARSLVQQVFVNDRAVAAIVWFTPHDATAGDIWFKPPACSTLPDLLHRALVAQFGKPDQTSWPNGPKFDFDEEFRNNWSFGQAGAFRFPAGGEIRLEYVERADIKSCMTRAVYYFADVPKRCVNKWGVWTDDCDW